MAPAGIHGQYVDVRQPIAGQQGQQTAGAQVGADQEAGLPDDAETAERRSAGGVAIVRMHDAACLDRMRVLVFVEESPFVAAGRVAVAYALMPCQLGRRLRRAVLSQILGRSAHDVVRGRQLACHVTGGTAARDADRHVIAFIDDVDHAVAQGNVELDIGILVHEFGPQRRQVQNAETERRVDAQQSTRLHGGRGNDGFRLGHFVKYGLGAFEQRFAAGRHRHFARAAV